MRPCYATNTSLIPFLQCLRVPCAPTSLSRCVLVSSCLRGSLFLHHHPDRQRRDAESTTSPKPGPVSPLAFTPEAQTGTILSPVRCRDLRQDGPVSGRQD